MSRRGNGWDNAGGRIVLEQLEEGADQEAHLQDSRDGQCRDL